MRWEFAGVDAWPGGSESWGRAVGGRRPEREGQDVMLLSQILRNQSGFVASTIISHIYESGVLNFVTYCICREWELGS